MNAGIHEYKAKMKLCIIALAMSVIFVLSRAGALTDEEKQAVDQVRAMQASLWEWLNSPPLRSAAAQFEEISGWEDVHPSQVDPGMSGLIGVEWSEFTTTLGPLAVKQASTDPIWAAHILRWFDKAGLVRGDKIMIFASASFPGFLVSALAASETRGLHVELAVSLGSSTWGANRMEAPWPLIELRLRSSGQLRTRSRYYTPGGSGETGANYSMDAMTLLEEASAAVGVPFLKPVDLNEVVLMKTEEIRKINPKLLVLIGGAASMTGGSDDILPPGLTAPGTIIGMGQGIARSALSGGIPILHLLNVRELSRQVGINSLFTNRIWHAVGIIFFCTLLITHRRWSFE